jgi:hypothetical protein
MPVQTVIKKRRDTAANWTSTNPTLAAGEEGYESDTGLSKTGNGTSAWTVLSYDATAHSKQMVKASEAVSKGQAVYVNGSDGTNMTVAKASNATEATSSKTFGLMNGTTASGALNTVVTEGLLGGLDTSAAAAGDPVWLGTSGNLIFGLANKPTAPAHLVFIGIVEQAHATTGKIFVKVQNGFELQELHNVSLSSLANKQVLQYDSATSLWKNATISAGVAVSETAPASPTAGDLWFNSADAKTYIYYDSTWVEMAPAGPAGPTGPTGVTGATGSTGATGPAGPPAMTLISSTTLGAGVSSATISSIPQTYKELRIQLSFTGSVGGPSAATVTFSGSTSGYGWGYVNSFASTGTGNVTPNYNYGINQAAIVLPGMTGGSTWVTIPDYSNATVAKNLQFFNYTGYMSSTVNDGAGVWNNNTTAITSMGFNFSSVSGYSAAYTINIWGVN